MIPAFAVEAIGIEGYGVWESINGLNTLGVIVQSVIGGTVLWKASTYAGARQIRKINALFWSAASLAIVLFMVAGLTGFCIYQKLQDWFHVPREWVSEYGGALSLTMAVAQIGVVVHVLFAIGASLQKAGLVALAQSFGAFFTAVITIGLLSEYKSLYAFPLGMAAGGTLSIFLLSYLVRSHCGLTLWPPERIRGDEAPSLLRFTGLLLLSNSTLLTRDALDKFIIAVVEGPSGAAYLGVALVITVLLSQVMAVLQTPFCAAVGRASANGQHEVVKQLYASFVVWYAALVGLLAVNIAVSRRPLIFFWFGREITAVEPYLIFTLLGATTAIAMTAAGVGVAKACGQPGAETRYLIITMVLTLCLKPLFVYYLNGLGAVASSCVASCVGSATLLYILHKRIELSWAATCKAMVIYCLTVAVGILGWYVGGLLAPVMSRTDALIKIILFGSATTFIYGLLIGGFIFLSASCKSLLKGKTFDS